MLNLPPFIRDSVRLVLSLGALLLASCAALSFEPRKDAPSPTKTAEPSIGATPASSAAPLFDATIARLTDALDDRLSRGVPVPEPIDAGGGYSHEQHKQNGKTIYEAGMLYLETGDKRYREFAASILQDYAAIYADLPLHPQRKEQTPGKLFWQGLNEAVWLVYAIQGYEAIRPDLSADLRTEIEEGVILPMADFLSEGSPQTFNRIHNHGTWAAAGVGMTGYVLGDKDMVDKALFGLDKSGDAGFIKQLDLLFSPDGYYAEGPYYQRYALMPFVLFAQAIETNEPEREIFNYRDGVLMKAITSTVQQSYAGRFFPINDAIREKGLNTVELRYALAIAYDLTGDPQLLDVVKMQDAGVVPTPEGRKLAQDIAAGLDAPFEFKSTLLSDGPSGQDGGLGVLRSGPQNEAAAVVFKATSQGLGHGHFDRLGLLYFDDGHEVVADYGAARFLNVEPKNGGRYLPENSSWAKQSIAHNTLVVDQSSHFGGDWREGQKHSPTILAFDEIDGVQVAAAETRNAYDGVAMQRLIAMAPRKSGGNYVIDIMRARSAEMHAYDLPVHFKGQLIDTAFDMTHAIDRLEPLGADNGYQHLWARAASDPIFDLSSLSWLIEDQFYTLSFKSNAGVTAHLTELGANDPNHNLRREQTLILRTEDDDADFISVYERHGRYDNDEEITVFDGGSIASIEHSGANNVGIYEITMTDGAKLTLLFAEDTAENIEHAVGRDETLVTWTGPVHVVVEASTEKKEATK